MNLINLKENKSFLETYIKTCSIEWGSKKSDEELKKYVSDKLNKILSNNYDKLISVIGLIDKENLIGFISLFKYDSDKKKFNTLVCYYVCKKKNIAVMDILKFLITLF